MKKYKLNTDKKSITPSAESMEKQKDFGKLFHQYESYTKRPKKPIYKDPKFFLIVLIVFLISYIILKEVADKEKQEVNIEEVVK